ncbi:MAG: hypothetical protein ACR2H5_25455 [Ktedonobacteraceae bacterium]
MELKEKFLVQIDTAINLYNELCKKARPHEFTTAGGLSFSDIDFEEISTFYATGVGVVERVVGIDSVYGKQILPFINDKYTYENPYTVARMAGILKALRTDVDKGFLSSARELIHGELFGDFLEMADFLLNEGFKDAAAVIGGGVLETHLHQLCIKNAISLDMPINNQTQLKKADRLNSDLAGASVYPKLDQKSITFWLDLRNKAAHAKYNEYTKEQVALLLQGIRDFILRYPA